MPRIVVATVLFACASAGCLGEPSPPASGEGEDTLAEGAPSPEEEVARTFDPGGLVPGDRVLGLTVESVDVERVLADSIWVGEVVFTGDLVLHGIYQRHPDWPLVELPCMEVVQPASLARVPRFPPDAHTGPGPRTWFCFENPDVALDLLGAPEPPREVVVALARYRAQRQLTDAFDVGEIVEALEIGPSSPPTLRVP